MQALVTWLKNPKRTLPLAPLLAAVFVMLLARNLGNYPSIFADEYYYNLFARLTPWSEAWIPSYLYYAVFASSSACGNGFLECVRLLNAVLFIATAPFIYLLARSVTNRARAGVVTMLAMLAPFNVYTNYFMPEVSYFLAFWAMTWLLFRFVAAARLPMLAAAGAVLGLTALIKVHALFLTLPLGLFLVWLAFAQRKDEGPAAARHWALNALLYVLVALGAAAAVRYSLGYALGGENSFRLLGLFYGTQKAHAKPLAELAMPALQVAGGHLIAWAYLFALPVAAVLHYGASRAARDEAGARVQALSVYAVLMLGAMLGVTALFSASIVGNGPAESLERLHLRYYDFMFPLLLILAAVQLSAAGGAGRRARLVIALGLGALLIYARMTLMAVHMPNIVDAPELWSLKHVALQNAITGLGLLALGCWVGAPRLGARVYLFLAVPLAALAGTAALTLAVRSHDQADAYVQAGLFARDYLNPSELDKMTVVGSDHAPVYAAKYHTGNALVNMLVLPEGEAFNVGQLGKQKQWVLVIGNHPAPEKALPQITQRNFALYTFAREDGVVLEADFSNPDLGFRSSSGISSPEPHGRWTDGPRVVFQTMAPLPRALRLRIGARAVGANIGAPVRITVGGQTLETRFTQETTEAVLDFDTDGKADTVTLEIPHPVAASSMGPNSSDHRMIGLAIEIMQLARRKAPDAGK